MGTNEELLAATEELKAEVHDLSSRLSAKELLYRRTRNLTKISLAIAALVGVVALVAIAALIRVNSVIDCMTQWGEASSERQNVLNTAAEDVALKKGLADDAMRVLVNNRNVDTTTTADAVADYNEADDARIRAEWRLQFLRDEYPPPLLEEYCSPGGVKDDSDPKAKGPSPAPTQSADSQAPQPQ